MKLINFLLKWLLIFIAGSLIAFSVVRLMSGDPVMMVLSERNLPATEENVNYLKREFGLDKALASQYFDWIANFTKGEWGKSYMTGVDLKPEILRRALVSLMLGLFGLIYASILAFWLGYMSSLKSGFFDKVTRTLTLFTQTVPVFILIILFVYFFGVKYKFIRFFRTGSLASLAVGTFFVGLPLIGPMSRTVRLYFLEVMRKPFFRFYIERGYKKEKALLKYCYHEPLQGLSGLLISQSAYVIGASSVVEFALSIQGLSTFLIESIAHRDYLIIQSYIMMIILWMFFVHLIFTLFSNVVIRRGSA